MCLAGTMLPLFACAVADNADQDDSLSMVYAELVALLRDRRQEALLEPLKAAQEAWLLFRDRECDWTRWWEEGSLARLERASCPGELARNRTAKLRQNLEALREYEAWPPVE
jgi:uncharacterized protein YecT (DUF1311 family)